MAITKQISAKSRPHLARIRWYLGCLDVPTCGRSELIHTHHEEVVNESIRQAADNRDSNGDRDDYRGDDRPCRTGTIRQLSTSGSELSSAEHRYRHRLRAESRSRISATSRRDRKS